ncbi:MAG: SagB/ThcOx family dehydrogenase [Actinobacteria bacterium]|uniref:Unannotated protein n=1 Tax=freshwater metagenome TaxID=449393 RepID=A0A6J6PXB2_9ZZZZ|nr:SagB/ThcOx family dehydrogenase [Actinomycetota bacterium]
MRIPTAEFASFVYGGECAIDDPAELFHEASRLYPGVAPSRLSVMASLGEPGVAQTLGRAGRVGCGDVDIRLPNVPLPSAPLADAIGGRVSRLPDQRRTLTLTSLASVFACSALTSERAGERRRPVASAGALYPLELYVVPLAVESLELQSYHYDPFRNGLVRVGDVDHATVEGALVDPPLAARMSALVVVTSVFWRSRVKYGYRGYRFALLEAGHVVQAMTTAATALGVAALPLGGYYDGAVDALIGANGVDEATIYLLGLGGDA